MKDGNWSYPGFISIGGGSIGWQWVIESIDLVLVFKTAKSVDSLVNGQITLGATAEVSAGPVGRHAEAATNTQINAEIYSYARSKGLFLGASLEGSSLSIDPNANRTFYDSDSITVENIFSNNVKTVPFLADQFQNSIQNLLILEDAMDCRHLFYTKIRS
jgi:lipid-binding SYLF domain-containing protein